ncbi:putative phosphotransacetylase [Neisseria meningitidis]|nr:putative phosphotransacetylase [Neisseria meningitidis]
MAKVLIVPVSAGLDASAVAQAFAKALDAQIFQAVDATAETLLAQGKSDDWFDALVGKVAALDAANLVIEGIAPDADKIYLAGKNVELALSLDAAAVFAVRSDNADADELANRLNLAKQFFAAAPGVLEGFVVDGAAASVAEAAAEKTGLTFFGSSDALKDVSVLAGREAKRLSPAQFRYNLIDFPAKPTNASSCPRAQNPAPSKPPPSATKKALPAASCLPNAKKSKPLPKNAASACPTLWKSSIPPHWSNNTSSRCANCANPKA